MSRKKDRKGKSFFYGIEGNKVYQAYYVGGDLYPTADSVKRKLEEIADFIHPEYHKKIGLIKDFAAGAVFIFSIAAIIVGFIIYYPKVF